MHRFFKEKEFDKISSELLNEFYPIEKFKTHYKFGAATTLSILTDIAVQYINNGHTDEMNAHDLIKIILELMHNDDETKTMYERLRKDGVKVEQDKM